MSPDFSEYMIYINQCLKQTHDAISYGNYEQAASIAYEMATAAQQLVITLRDQNGR